MEFEGHQRDAGVDVALEVACFDVFRDGLIFRAHHIADNTGLYAKVGLLDPKKFADHFG